MKNLIRTIFGLILITTAVSATGQSESTYKVNGTTYVNGERYSTTGKPEVERSSSARSEFLKSKGYNKVPNGYQVDHIKPLSEGGADIPSNMQLIPIYQHKSKTAREKSKNSSSSTYRTPSYKSNSTYRNSNSYSKPSYSNTPSRNIQTGSRGGQYYINSNGNKTYVKKK